VKTHCNTNELHFQDLNRRSVLAAFDGGRITSDAGALLLREIEYGQQFIQRFCAHFNDLRDTRFIEHSVQELISQRVYAIGLGYEDLIDHDLLRADPLLAVACGKQDPEGKNRRSLRDVGKPLAGKSTLNRLETAGSLLSVRPRCKKIIAEMSELEEYFIDTFVRTSPAKAPRVVILDFDATNDPLHGKQEGRFFHGYYDCYCYLPLYVFCGDQLLWAQLRKADIDASAGALEIVLVKSSDFFRNRFPLLAHLASARFGSRSLVPFGFFRFTPSQGRKRYVAFVTSVTAERSACHIAFSRFAVLF